MTHDLVDFDNLLAWVRKQPEDQTWPVHCNLCVIADYLECTLGKQYSVGHLYLFTTPFEDDKAYYHPHWLRCAIVAMDDRRTKQNRAEYITKATAVWAIDSIGRCIRELETVDV